MGIMTISLPQEAEDRLRALAKKEYGGKKGAIQHTFVDAIDALEQIVKAKEIAKRQIALMQKGFPMGGKIPSREEIYERD